MAYPVLPIEARTDVTKSYKNDPYVKNYNPGQITAYVKRNAKHIANVNVNFNTYVGNIDEVIDFLNGRRGFLPFTLPQDNQVYICTDYSVSFIDFKKGTIQMNLVKLTYI